MLKQFAIIGEINKAINNSETLDQVLKSSAKILINSCSADYAVLWYKDQNDLLHPYYSVCPKDLSQEEYKPDEGIIGKVFSSQKSISILDYPNNKDESIEKTFEGIKISSLICSPISNKEGNVGSIVFIKKEGQFTLDEVSIMEMVPMLAMMEIEDCEKFQQAWVHGKELLRVSNLRKDYINGPITTKVLKGINLDIYEGEFLVLLGESGCGKSTLLNLIGGMDTPTSGSIMFKDADLAKATDAELTEFRRHHIGFIFQQYNLMPNLNVSDNINLISELVKDPLDTEEVLKLVHLEDKMNNFPSELSGGQQQRVSIARALVKKPTLILADEPTAALDYETSIEVLDALEDVYKNGTTLVMVTHNEEIAKMANRVVKFRNGKVYEITINRHPLHAADLVW